MVIEKVSFPNSKGNVLAGTLHIPKKVEAVAVLCHGFRADQNHAFLPFLAKALAKNNIAVLRFDMTGSGKSKGDFETLTITQEIQDVQQAKAFLKKKYPKKKLFLIGHSLGGMVSILAGAKDKDISAIVTIAPPLDYRRKRVSLPNIQKWKKEGAAYLITSFSKKLKKLNYVFYEDALQQDMNEALQNNTPLLVIHGEKDKVVTPLETKQLAKKASGLKKVVCLPKAGHFIEQKHEQETMVQEILPFLHEYL